MLTASYTEISYMFVNLNWSLMRFHKSNDAPCVGSSLGFGTELKFCQLDLHFWEPAIHLQLLFHYVVNTDMIWGEKKVPWFISPPDSL